MGGVQSTQATEQQRLRQAELDRLKRISADEEKRRIDQKEKDRIAAEERIKKMQLDKELEEKKMQLEAEEEHLKLTNKEKNDERNACLADKKAQMEHERLMQGQDRMFSIVETLFKKVEITDIRDASFGAAVLQSIQAGQPVDKDVLKAVSDKVPNAPPSDIKRLVHNVIRTCQEEEEENERGSEEDFMPRRSGELVRKV